MTNTDRTAELVRRAREDIGMTQRELAEKAGTSATALSAIEAGRRTPSTELLSRILSAAHTRPSIPVDVYAAELIELAKKHHLSNVRIFGSLVRGDDGPDSDVDVLATADQSQSVFEMMAFASHAKEMIGFPVDLVFDTNIGPAMDEITRTAVPL